MPLLIGIGIGLPFPSMGAGGGSGGPFSLLLAGATNGNLLLSDSTDLLLLSGN